MAVIGSDITTLLFSHVEARFSVAFEPVVSVLLTRARFGVGVGNPNGVESFGSYPLELRHRGVHIVKSVELGKGRGEFEVHMRLRIVPAVECLDRFFVTPYHVIEIKIALPVSVSRGASGIVPR
jgi:hypothetical protein